MFVRSSESEANKYLAPRNSQQDNREHMDNNKNLFSSEVSQINERYKRREKIQEAALYHPLSPYVFMVLQELDRALYRWVHRANIMPVADKKVLEIGCGTGSNLLRLIGMGFSPESMTANELSHERAAEARNRLPEVVKVIPGDAMDLNLPQEAFDVVLQSTVFTSILDDSFKKALANKIWSFVKPGGGVLWYDFIYNNPRNPDVKGIGASEIQRLFPNSDIKTWRITLAPPVGRQVTRSFQKLYHVFNAFPFLRTHLLCWIEK